MNVRSSLISWGLIPAHQTPNSSGEFILQCPECKHDPAKCFVNGGGKGISCKHCSYSPSWRKFALRYQPPSKEDEALETFVKACEERLLQDHELIAYLTERGLTKDTIKSQRLGYCDPRMYKASEIDVKVHLAYEDSFSWELENRITIPYTEDSIVLTVRGKSYPDLEAKPKYKSLKGSKSLPYIPSKLDTDLPVILVEGELDSIILRQNGIQAIGIPGAGNFKPDWTSHLKHLYIAFDGDEAGQKGADKVIKQILEIRRIDLPEGYDVGEYISTFGVESFKSLIDKSVFYLQGKPQTDDKLSSLVDAFLDWAWSNHGTIGPKILWAPRLNEVFSGWSPGLYLLGARESFGKTKLLTKAIYAAAAENPEDTIAVYVSLDDPLHSSLAGFIALHTQIDINDVRSPRNKLEHDTIKLANYLEFVETFKHMKNLIVRDGSHGKRISTLKYFLKSLRAKYPDKKIVCAVDSLSKLVPDREKDEQHFDAASMGNVKAYLATSVKDMAVRYEIALISPTDLRKTLPGVPPTIADLSGAAELGYEADVVMILDNEMQTVGSTSKLTWMDEENGNKLEPIIELRVPKNKITGSDRQHLMFKLLSRQSDLQELSLEEQRYYESLKYSSENSH